MLNRPCRIIVVLLLFSTTLSVAEEQNPLVLSTIRPLDLLVNELAGNQVSHNALLNAQQSPHQLHLRPSQRLLLNQAKIILWYGPELEPMISNILQGDKTLSNQAVNLQPQEDAHHDHDENHQNPHYWLDRHHSIDTATQITAVLTTNSPELLDLLDGLLKQLINDLNQIDQTLHEELHTIRSKRFLDLHNAWELFADDFQLSSYDTIGHQSLEFVGAKSMLNLKRELDSGQYDCVIGSPESNLRLVDNLLSDTSTTRLLILDPLGNDLPDDSGFVDLLESAIKKMAAC